MNTEKKSFTFQLFVMAGFLFFFYMFFALANSIYRDYKLEAKIGAFEAEINELAVIANQKPKELMYLQSDEYKDLYAKESLDLLNPGEKLIIVPKEDQNVEQGPVELKPDVFSPDSVLNQPYPIQWKEYFFGQTLSVGEDAPEEQASQNTENKPAEEAVPQADESETSEQTEPVEG